MNFLSEKQTTKYLVGFAINPVRKTENHTDTHLKN